MGRRARDARRRKDSDPIPSEGRGETRDAGVPAAPARRLLAWFDPSRRPMPWRETREPYRIWISEIMLQQTTVAAVVPYYERFVAAFPTVAALAAALPDAVMKMWEGLGYYSRARNLHKAANILVGRHGGKLPGSVAELAALPGIGLSTAGAIASTCARYVSASMSESMPKCFASASDMTLIRRSERTQPRIADPPRRSSASVSCPPFLRA